MKDLIAATQQDIIASVAQTLQAQVHELSREVVRIRTELVLSDKLLIALREELRQHEQLVGAHEL